MARSVFLRASVRDSLSFLDVSFHSLIGCAGSPGWPLLCLVPPVPADGFLNTCFGRTGGSPVEGLSAAGGVHGQGVCQAVERFGCQWKCPFDFSDGVAEMAKQFQQRKRNSHKMRFPLQTFCDEFNEFSAGKIIIVADH